MKTESETKIHNAKLKILNSNSNMKIFSCLLYKFDLEFDNNHPSAYVTFEQNKLKIRFNEEFAVSLTAKEIVYILIHEISHVLSNHLERGKNKQYPSLYNIAIDHVINERIDKDISSGNLVNISTPNDRCILKYFLNANKTAEEIYDYLVENANIEKQEKIVNNDSGGENGKLEYETIQIKMPDGQEINLVSDIIYKQSAALKEEIKNIKSEANSILNSNSLLSGNSKGKNRGSLIEYIKEELEIKLPWDKLVEIALKTHTKKSSDNKTWKNINKRLYSNYNLILPGNELNETLGTLLIVIDTSGSMSVEDFKKFVSIIKNSINYFDYIIKIDHDHNITDYKELTTDDVLMLNEKIYTFTGRGGTSHLDVFNKIESLNAENKNLDISLVIFLTDYISDIESIWSRFKWVNKIPVKIVSTKKTQIAEFVDKSPIFI